MKVARRVAGAITAAALAVPANATDFPCDASAGSPPPHPTFAFLASAGGTLPSIHLPDPALPKPGYAQLVLPKTIAFDNVSKSFVGTIARRNPRIEQQVDPIQATDEARKIAPINAPPDEQARLDASGACRTAYADLVAVFETHRASMGYLAEEGRTVADFIPWYYQSSLAQADRDRVAPVVRAQERFAAACLEKRIPPELNASLIQRAVGIVSFEDKVFCTALRISPSEILTAKHCFVDANTGALLDDTAAATAGTGRMWFTYEAEPAHRFGICADSLPKPTASRLPPSADNVRVRIRATNTSAVPLKWAAVPLRNGQPLYLRGYFPFAPNETKVTDRLRSTSAGGCMAHTAAGRCFFHACQTTPIMSGAPIFVRPPAHSSQQELEVAGIHLGSALLSDPGGTHGAVCQGADGSRVPASNFGYQP